MRYKINGITDDPKQRFNVQIPNSDENLEVVLNYLPSQQAWYLDLFYKDFSIYGYKVALSPNMLREFRNIIPFGISVSSMDNIYPMEITAFSSDRVNMYVLDKSDVKELEYNIYVG